MSGGILAVSREVNNLSHYKKEMERLGFTNVHLTSLEKDALSFLIQELKPDALVMGSHFYQCSTPYMMGLLHREFPKLYLASASIGEYPPDLAMYFILNGVKCYVNIAEGVEEFYQGLEAIRNRRQFIPVSVQKRIDARKEYPDSARILTPITTEVLRCICNGFSKEDIADNLGISGRTVENHRKELYRSLNARNAVDLFVTALALGVVTQEELVFRHSRFVCTPLPGKGEPCY
ncbi:MAG: LuxR C-terminal-related transcriptional regulator [Spirochaetaceae bacterium]|jgi:DNA-binding NarL/FixJ family response regulator|nr:LuxR C-terminal-related transcriptional regulator [Spirochaetaceae bacterium]